MKDVTHQAILARLQLAASVPSEGALSGPLQVSTQAIYDARKRGKVPDSWIRVIAEKFDVSADWLFFGRGPMRPPLHLPEHFVQGSPQESVPAPIHAAYCLPHSHCEEELVMIPRMPARLLAGTGAFAVGTGDGGRYAFRADWIRRKGDVSQMVLVDVTGNAMAPDIHHGDMVLIDQGQTSITAYGMYAVCVEDAVFIKQARLRPGQLVLHSLNPEYDDIFVDTTSEQARAARIIGRVLWVGRDLA